VIFFHLGRELYPSQWKFFQPLKGGALFIGLQLIVKLFLKKK